MSISISGVEPVMLYAFVDASHPKDLNSFVQSAFAMELKIDIERK